VSRREQQAMRKRLLKLEADESRRRSAYAEEFPGVQIGHCNLDHETASAISTARKLSHAVCVQMHGTVAYFFAVPLDGSAE